MMFARRNRAVLLGVLTLGTLCGQGQRVENDCVVPFTFTAAAQSTPLTSQGHNLNGCVDWRLVYFSTGFSALSLVVQSAPDSAGAPGTWATFAGTVLEGINPNTSITGGTTHLSGFFPWNRVYLTSVTGTGVISGILYGCRSPGCSSGGGSGGGGGGGGAFGCGTASMLSTAVTLSASGLTQIVAATTGQTINVCDLTLSFASGVDVQLEVGTGTNCGTGTATVSGLYKNVAGMALDTPFPLPISKAFCVNLGSAVTGGGLLLYTKQ